jgi:DNA-binding Lrp family transcriptional regulator
MTATAAGPGDGGLDQLDTGLIALLTDDGRAPVRQLAQALGVAEQTAKHRLNRLLESETVRITTLVDPAVVGRPTVALLAVDLTSDPLTAAEELAAHPGIQWVATTTDVTTVLAQAGLTGNAALLDLVNRTVRAVPGVQTVTVHTVLRAYYRQPYDTRPTSLLPQQPWLGSEARPRDLDDTDRTLLGALQDDGRATFTALSRLTGLSVAATRQRFVRLSQDDVLRVTCIPDPRKLGMHGLAMARILVNDSSTGVAHRLAQWPETTYVVEVAGAFNIHVDLVCRDEQHLTRCFGAIRTMPGVETAELLVYRDIVKMTSRWS